MQMVEIDRKKHERIQQCHRDRTSQATSQIGALMWNSTCVRLQGCVYQILYNLRFVYWLFKMLLLLLCVIRCEAAVLKLISVLFI